MVSVARKNLLHDKGRLAISIAGVGFAVVLILVLAGLYDGFEEGARAYVEESGADLFVAQDGTTDMFHSFSILSLNLSERISAVPGVDAVSPPISRQVEIHLSNGHAKAAIVGFDELGGPWHVIRGRLTVGPRELIVDKTLASKAGLDLGSTVEISMSTFTVGGLARRTTLIREPFLPRSTLGPWGSLAYPWWFGTTRLRFKSGRTHSTFGSKPESTRQIRHVPAT